jgi:hypothetical protein
MFYSLNRNCLVSDLLTGWVRLKCSAMERNALGEKYAPDNRSLIQNSPLYSSKTCEGHPLVAITSLCSEHASARYCPPVNVLITPLMSREHTPAKGAALK